MSGAELPTVIFVMGPTASGKTELAMRLADALPVDLISVDSALIYRGMDIGTAKPSAAELARYPHQLIDICDPAERYSAEQFRRDALREIEATLSRGRIPLLVGGTMLYYRALEYGLAKMPAADPNVRADLDRLVETQGLAALHAELKAVDPLSAQRIHPNDPQRTLRALEVHRISGRPLSEWQAEAGESMPYRAIKLVRSPADRAVLHQRIDRRFEQMVEQGFEDEVRQLLGRGDLDPDLPAMRSVGYRQMAQYLRGEIDHPSMLAKGQAATRQLAKRQITWLRSEREAHWLDEEAGNVVEQAINVLRSAGISSEALPY